MPHLQNITLNNIDLLHIHCLFVPAIILMAVLDFFTVQRKEEQLSYGIKSWNDVVPLD